MSRAADSTINAARINSPSEKGMRAMRMTARPPTIIVNRLPPTMRSSEVHCPKSFSPPMPGLWSKPERVAEFMAMNRARTGLGLPAAEPNFQMQKNPRRTMARKAGKSQLARSRPKPPAIGTGGGERVGEGGLELGCFLLAKAAISRISSRARRFSWRRVSNCPPPADIRGRSNCRSPRGRPRPLVQL